MSYRGQRSEVRGQKSEVRSQRSEVRSQRSDFLFFAFCFLSSVIYHLSSISLAQDSSEYVRKAWTLKDNPSELYKTTDECITKFSPEAEQLALNILKCPTQTEIEQYKVMNDVATCYFIKGETLRDEWGTSGDEAKAEGAIKTLQVIIDKYPCAFSFDPRGWYWSVKEKAEIIINQIKDTKKVVEPADKIEPEIKIFLYDEGGEFPVDYVKYGEFAGLGTKDYKYIIKDSVGLSRAVGEGIYPNTSSIKFDPEFVKIKRTLGSINHWEVFNSRDLRTAFYKWAASTPEPDGVRLFYIADILERSGLIKQAIKAYYAILVHFPSQVGWTYWHTPWYVGKVALYRIKYLLKNNPQLGLSLEAADIQVINGYDHDIRNDIFIVNPGRLVKSSILKKIGLKGSRKSIKVRKLGKILETRGQGHIKLVKHQSGDWQLLLDSKPFIIKGITYSPTRVGESPDKGTHQNWTTQDTNNNGLIDSAFEAFVDKNCNNIQDSEEKAKGDFQLLKEMGVNTLRVYHQPFKINKQLIGQMHQKYGIYIIIGDFLGKYALGSKAPWDPGTDYDDPAHKENMLNSVKEMVNEFKDEPYVLLWLLGNENVYGVACNADKKPEAFFKFANEAARLIKSQDPQKRPVAIASGDILYLDIFAKSCPDIDVFGTNAYRGRHGFLDIWDEVKRVADRPVFITEYGAPSYAKGYSLEEAQDYQSEYHKACWLDITDNSTGYGAGNAIGGFVFEWLDEWWKAYEPSYHDKKGLFAGPFLDGYMHEEWLGIAGQGDGRNSPFLRQLKKAYFTYRELWSKK